MIDRRDFVGLALSGLAFSPAAAVAQGVGKSWRIGVIGTLPPPTHPANARIWDAFVQTLREQGFVEGRNLAFEMRFAEGSRERAASFAAELVRLNVDLIVVVSGPGVRAAMAETTTIPIVFVGQSDPVGAGYVASLAQPGANATGIADLGPIWCPSASSCSRPRCRNWPAWSTWWAASRASTRPGLPRCVQARIGRRSPSA